MITLPIGAIELLGELANGATLGSCWKYRRHFAIKPKRLYVLSRPNGEMVRVQFSAVRALVSKRAVRAVPATFGRTRYELVK